MPKERKILASNVNKPTSNQTKACRNCGKPLNDSKYCPNCGTRVITNTPVIAKNSKKKKKGKELERLGVVAAMPTTNSLCGFEYMFEDGVAESAPGIFSQTLEFSDVSYENERDDVKLDTYFQMSALHAVFTAGTCFQFNLVNFPCKTMEAEAYLNEVGLTTDLAAPYNKLIAARQRKGRIEFDRKNYLTFSVPAESEKAAAPTLNSLYESASSILVQLDSSVKKLNGVERAKAIKRLLRGEEAPFFLNYERLHRTNKAHVRDFIVPQWAGYPKEDQILRRSLLLPGRICKSFHIQDVGSELNERSIRTIRALPIPMNISLCYRPQETKKVLQTTLQNINVVDSEIMEYQKGIARNGADITMIPPALERKSEDARELHDFIVDRDQIESWWQGIITIFADDAEALQRYEHDLLEMSQRWSLDVVELPLTQEQALAASMPVAYPRLVDKFRSLTHGEAAAMIPFSSEVISGDPHTSLLFGTNVITNAHIFVPIDKLKSPHGWVLGPTGSGKSMEMNAIWTYSLLQYPKTHYDRIRKVWTCPDEKAPQWFGFDFHEEYVSLARRFQGAISYFGPTESSRLNPMDIASMGDVLEITDIRRNADGFLALIGSMMGRQLDQREQSVVDRCLDVAYKPHLGETTRPDLEDLYKAMKADGSQTALDIAESIEMYVYGSMNSCCGQTNVKVDAQMNLFVMSQLGQTMQTLVMLSALQFVRKCTMENNLIGRPTYLIIEEVQKLFDNMAAVRLLDSYFGELRKFGLHCICVTQHPNRVLEHKLAKHLFENSGWFVLLPMDEDNYELVKERFKLSVSQASRIRPKAEKGTGLLIADGVKVGFNNRINAENPLYTIWNTDAESMTTQRAIARQVRSENTESVSSDEATSEPSSTGSISTEEMARRIEAFNAKQNLKS